MDAFYTSCCVFGTAYKQNELWALELSTEMKRRGLELAPLTTWTAQERKLFIERVETASRR